MCDPSDVDDLFRVVNGVDDAIIANTDAPFVHATLELFASSRTRLRGKFLDARAMRATIAPGIRFNSFSALEAKTRR